MFLFKVTNWGSVPHVQFPTSNIVGSMDFTNAQKRVFPMLYMKNCLSTLFMLHHIFLIFSSCICICIYISHIYTHVHIQFVRKWWPKSSCWSTCSSFFLPFPVQLETRWLKPPCSDTLKYLKLVLHQHISAYFSLLYLWLVVSDMFYFPWYIG